MRNLLSALLVVFTVSSALAGRVPLEPADDAGKNPTFSAFRDELRTIVAARDVKALLARVDKDIEHSFGGGAGIKDFIESWGLNGPNAKKSELWVELGKALAMGGSFVDDEFIAPYVTSNWPEDYDAYEYMAVIGNNVNVRAKPSKSAKVIRTASYEVLRVAEEGSHDPAWVAVVLDDERIAFVASEFMRSAIDYRAHFKVVDGSWKMWVFIAGD